MNKTYRVYLKISKFGFLITTILAALGVMLLFAGLGLFPALHHFMQGFANEMAFLNYNATQGILGILMTFIFGRKWLKTLGRIFNKTPILVADDFGLEINRAAGFTVIGWEYIDKISIELYAPSNSERKRPTLIIRYRTPQEKVLFIPISSLSKPGKAVLKALLQRTKKSKF